jgi:hypothetical protein
MNCGKSKDAEVLVEQQWSIRRNLKTLNDLRLTYCQRQASLLQCSSMSGECFIHSRHLFPNKSIAASILNVLASPQMPALLFDQPSSVFTIDPQHFIRSRSYLQRERTDL